jgi:hypothetical protein
MNLKVWLTMLVVVAGAREAWASDADRQQGESR